MSQSPSLETPFMFQYHLDIAFSFNKKQDIRYIIVMVKLPLITRHIIHVGYDIFTKVLLFSR